MNGSGEVLVGGYDTGGSAWRKPIKPGNGPTIRGVTTYESDQVYACDDNATTFRSTDGGATWSELGIDGAGVSLYDIAVVAEDEITVAGGSAGVFRYNGAVRTRANTPGRQVAARTLLTHSPGQLLGALARKRRRRRQYSVLSRAERSHVRR